MSELLPHRDPITTQIDWEMIGLGQSISFSTEGRAGLLANFQVSLDQLCCSSAVEVLEIMDETDV